MLGNLAVAHPHNVDRLKLDFPTGGSHAEEGALMCPVVGLVRRDAVAIGDLLVEWISLDYWFMISWQ